LDDIVRAAVKGHVEEVERNQLLDTQNLVHIDALLLDMKLED
jgi:hypothetical protein